MNVSWFFCFTFLLLIHTVQSDSVEGVIGDTVVLPCSIGQNPEDVYWRNAEKKVVCDISDGAADFDQQFSAYRDRVKVFPSEIKKGNFSIILINVTASDAGAYTCHAPNIAKLEVKLIVKEKRTTTVKEGTQNKTSRNASNNGESRIRADGLLAFLLGCALFYNLVF